MKAYELILKGFDGSTDTTDHLIKWVWVTDSLVDKLKELCHRIDAKVYPMIGIVGSVGFDATITTHKELLKFLTTCKEA